MTFDTNEDCDIVVGTSSSLTKGSGFESLWLVLLVGTKLQHVIATLALESAAITGSFSRVKLKPRDKLFWFKKPELLLSFSRFAGQFLCSYSTLPLYALVTQMGTNYKAALIPQRIRETIHGWGKAARRKRRMRMFPDDSTVHTDTSTVMSLEEYDHDQLVDSPRTVHGAGTEIELQPTNNCHRGSSFSNN